MTSGWQGWEWSREQTSHRRKGEYGWAVDEGEGRLRSHKGPSWGWAPDIVFFEVKCHLSAERRISRTSFVLNSCKRLGDENLSETISVSAYRLCSFRLDCISRFCRPDTDSCEFCPPYRNLLDSFLDFCTRTDDFA